MPFRDVKDSTVAVYAFALMHNFLTSRNELEIDDFQDRRVGAVFVPQQGQHVAGAAGIPTGEERRDTLAGWALAYNGLGGQVIRAHAAAVDAEAAEADSDDD